MKTKQPNIIILDIETSPNIGFSWEKYETNIIEFIKEWHILSFAYKELGKKRVYGYKLNDFKLYKKDKENDLELCKKLWEVLDSADIVIGHNSMRFDIPKINSRLNYHKIPPYSPIKQLDTRRIAKYYFKFTSNSLNELSQYLNIGKKLKHHGFGLWKGCMRGDKLSWNIMMKYNKQDVVITEKLYKRFLPWINNHPNYGLYIDKEYVCPNCGSEKVQKRGFSYTRMCKYQRYRCQNCGGWSQSRFSEKNVYRPTLK